jgi:cystathionine beta-lyase
MPGRNTKEEMEYSTLAIHGGRKDDKQYVGVNYPVYLSSTFMQDSLNEFSEFMYTRSKNPTRDNAEQLAAQLEGAKYGLAMASGMAANSLAFSLIKPGEKVLLNSNVYGGTWNFVSHIFEDRNIDFEIVTDFNNYDFDTIDENVSTVFIETPSNPLLEITDLAKVSERAKKKGLRVIVDNTFMTSYLQKPLELGADIVTYSATKYYSGHSDIIAGLVLVNDDALYEKLKFNQKTLGAILDPMASFLLVRGMKTLPLRMDRHEQNAMKVAEFLKDCGACEHVYYPGLKDHPGYDIQRRQAKGNGAVVSAVFKPEYDCNKFCTSTEYFDLAVSLGGIESLVCHPATMTHEEYSEELQNEIGITSNLLRFSVGIEDIDDLLGDIKQALEKSRI